MHITIITEYNSEVLFSLSKTLAYKGHSNNAVTIISMEYVMAFRRVGHRHRESFEFQSA